MTDLNQLRALATSDDPEAAIDAALGAAPPESLAALLAQTAPADRFLRAVLRNRLAMKWPVTTDAYQDACFFLAAERVGAGARAYASELGIPGNDHATLNDPVLDRQVQSPEGHHRVAAAQMMRPRHLHLIARQLEAESDPQVRAALLTAGRRIAGEPGAPPSDLLVGSERLGPLVRIFGREKGWLRWSTAAACFGQEAGGIAGTSSEPFHSSGAHFFVAEGGRKPPPLVPEQVDDRDAALRLAHAVGKALGPKDALNLVELWLRAQTNLWLPDLRYWLGLPALASALEGVLLRSGETPARVHAGAVDGDLDLNAMLLVHHPVDGSGSPWQAQAPAWQTHRPCFAASDLPEFASAPAIELADWKKRTKALGYEGVREKRAVIHTVRSVGGVRIHHSGHGEGYGEGPQKILSVSYPTHSSAAISEVVWDVRRLLGIDPLKTKR